MFPASSFETSMVVMSGASLTESPLSSVKVCDPARRRVGPATRACR
jgi:hypothetical protein